MVILGHMSEERLPIRQLLKPQPFHGPTVHKKRWRDKVASDLRAIGIGGDWYELCQDRMMSGLWMCDM